MGHIHLTEVIERAALLPRTEVVLSHFSARYASEDVRRIVAARLPEALCPFVRAFGATPEGASVNLDATEP
jgi:hypothetical protein